MINGNEFTGVLIKGVMMNIMFREAMIKFLIVLLLPAGLFCVIKMCRKTPSLQGWGYKARPPNLRK